jgi:hypothetical protein
MAYNKGVVEGVSPVDTKELAREALRQTWISRGLDRYKVSANVCELLSIVSRVDKIINTLSDEEVDYFL